MVCVGTPSCRFMCGCSVQAAVPSLSTQLGGRPETQFGAAFSCRGGGYLLGSVLAALSGSKDSFTNNSPRLSLALLRRWLGARPSLLMALTLLLAGVATAGVVATRAWGGFLVLMVVQGLGLGMVDVLGNATLLEAWAGHRAVDPLMKGLHALFGAGAVASPATLGAIGFHPTFRLYAGISALPLLCWALGQALSQRRHTPKASPLTVAAQAEAANDEQLSLSQNAAPDPDTATGKEEGEHEDPPSIPRAVRLLICSFFFLYVGLEVGFGGWLPSVLLLQHLTPSAPQAAYAAAAFWGAITLGRLATVALATLLPPRRLLLGQLSILTLGALFLTTALPSKSLPAARAAGAVFGAGMSSVFPTMLSLPADMGYALDIQSTSHFLVASCLGEGLLPVAMGEAMHALGTAAFPSCVLLGVAGMWLLALALLLPRWLGACGGKKSGKEGAVVRGFEMVGGDKDKGGAQGAAAM